jgi:penicillin-binding protein 1B
MKNTGTLTPGVSPGPPSAIRRWLGGNGRWRRVVFLAIGIPAIVLSVVLGYYYVVFSRMMDARLNADLDRAVPRVFARPFVLHRGQAVTPRQLEIRLNDLGYALRARVERPGEFAVGRDGVTFIPRGGDYAGKTVRAVFGRPPAAGREPLGIQRLEIEPGRRPVERFALEAPLVTALIQTGREKRRHVPLDQIPKRVTQAVLAIEDRRFFDHPGVDPIRAVAALLTNIRGDRPYLVGGSTITQQVVKNTFLTPEQTMRRKLLEQFMALILERRLTKEQILELYLNDVYLGHRGSFAIHGVAEGARLFFGKDVNNLSLAEAATIAGVIQSPQIHSPFKNVTRARDRRNVALAAMADAGFVSSDAAERASREPLTIVARALDAEAPYFVDLISQLLQDGHKDVMAGSGTVDVHTTLDLHLQRIAQDVMRDELARVDKLLARRKRGQAQGALIAVDPRTGDILALVGGRSYNESQYNRAVNARRQPGSVFKPFVYLAAFEQAAEAGRTDLTPAATVLDEPTTFTFNDQVWTPANYENEYDGEITLRRALALSRNIATIKVAETTGYDHVAGLWRRVGAGTPPRPYPSIALGVFEATPYEIATAYTLFANDGAIRPLRALVRIDTGDDSTKLKAPPLKPVARPDTTFLVTNMMRSVLNEGTGAAARGAGFRLDAAGKSGTTNDLRDAWFVGFTPELLTVVWVGFDDNRALGLSGSQAALPIWTTFMIRALAGHPNASFAVPDNVVLVEIDRDTGKRATPACPRLFNEAFLAGTEPIQACELHHFRP